MPAQRADPLLQADEAGAAMSTATIELHAPDGLLERADALGQEAADTAYRVVLEALTNVRRHAPRATRVEVRAAQSADGSVQLTVTDALGDVSGAGAGAVGDNATPCHAGRPPQPGRGWGRLPRFVTP